MAFAITANCCNDASCVSVCPVNCIHPTPDEPEFGTTDMLYVDPATCIDCGACADACPVDAIFPVEALRGPEAVHADRNRAWFEEHPTDNAWGMPEFPRSLPIGTGPLRIAVVGAGPAAAYTTRFLLQSTDAEITLIDRLPVPGGLLRSGVAPDHPATKRIGDGFAEVYRHPRVRIAFHVEVGTDVSHDELLEHHSAVVYAVGAATDRSLDVPGENLMNSHSATDVVGWYNAHPDRTGLPVDVSGERAVVVGTGNVALDLARILLADPAELARTDISDVALKTLRGSRIREVVLLGRRGPETAAFTAGEFLALRATPGLRIVLDEEAATTTELVGAPRGSAAALLSEVDAESIDWSAPPPEGKRIVLRFNSPVAALEGDTSVAALKTAPSSPGGPAVRIPAGLVVRAIGYRGRPVAGLPFDESSGTVPNDRGQVLDPTTGSPLPGTYVAGWIKRGPSGGIGTNRACAGETVDRILDDAAAGVLRPPAAAGRAFERLLRRRGADVIDQRAAAAIDRAERDAGQRSGRPRVKFGTVEEMLRSGRRGPRTLLGPLDPGRLIGAG
ncbi:MAG TPA: FAD-dependent oxidoreductase [Frankiaceae bacterium]|nr:FAD-dependent oxidoreductase [Frankiaceae bacterium]